MKKVVGMFLAVMSAAVLWAETEGTVAVQNFLNARKEPTVKSPVMMKLKSGTKVTIIRRCGENWLEIALPPDAPVYVDEVFVVGGKASRDLKMFSGKGRKFPVWGELKKGEAVTFRENDRAYGWVRIAPPERLRLYVVALYIDGAEAVKPEAKPEAKPEQKPEAKPEAKPEQKPEAKPEAKPEKKPEAKPEKKPAVKPDKKPEAKLTPAKPDAALLELGIADTDKGRMVTWTGEVGEAADNRLKAASFLLLEGKANKGFIYYPGKAAELKKLVGQQVSIRGTEFKVPNWKRTVVLVQSIQKK